MQKSVCGCEYVSGIFQKREEGKKKFGIIVTIHI